MKKKIRPAQAFEVLAWGVAAIATMIAGWLGTRNAVHDEMEDIRENGKTIVEEGNAPE